MRSWIVVLGVVAVSVVVGLGACGDEGGGGSPDGGGDAVAGADTVGDVGVADVVGDTAVADTDTAVADTDPDTATVADTAADTATVADTATAADTATDTDTDTATAADTAADPDTVTSTCTASCVALERSEAAATLGVHATGAPGDGALAADPIAGVFEATAIDLYTDGAFLDEVPLTIGTHGDNAAVASVADGVWALRLDLRLAFGLEGVAAGGGTLDTILELATCEAGGELAPPTTCGDTWPDDVVAPAVAVTRWDADSGALTLGFDLAPALILAYVAPEYRDAAEALLVGPVTVRVAFARR